MNIRSADDDGIREANGHWRPSYPASFIPIFERPFSVRKFLKWLFGWGGYLFPTNVLYAVLAWLAFTYLQPPIAAYAQPGAGEILVLLARNTGLIVAVYGFQHLVLYGLKLHGTSRKYNPQWPATDAKRFLFRNQNLDNMFWTIVSGGLVWTGYEVLYFWMVANGWVGTLSIAASPVLFVAIFLLIPFYRQTHFYFVHRLIHWKPLFRRVHYLHHRYVTVNFGTPMVPWDRWLGRYYDGTTPYKGARSKA